MLAEEAGAVGEGRTAVLAPAARVAGAARAAARCAPGPGPDTPDGPADPDVDLTSPVVVLPISSAKGLEFDAVVVVEPAEVLAESPRGANDLYVAITRSTQRLAVVHAAPLPEMLRGLGRRLSGGARRTDGLIVGWAQKRPHRGCRRMCVSIGRGLAWRGSGEAIWVGGLGGGFVGSAGMAIPGPEPRPRWSFRWGRLGGS